jgi:predicted DNA-binding transcriptional regulator AlpA
MRYSRDQLWNADELAAEYGIGEATLADWRCDGTGPPYLKIGRIVFYPKALVDDWLDGQVIVGLPNTTGEKDVIKEKERKLPLSIPVHEERVQRRHRFGRHATKHGRGDDN